MNTREDKTYGLADVECMNETDVVRLDLPASLKYLNILGACVEAFLTRVESVAEFTVVCYNVTLAVHETCTNIINHAYEPGQAGRIGITLQLMEGPRRIVVEVRDTGRSFNLDAVPEPDLDEIQVHGYGLFLIQALMDRVTYEPGANQNRWELVKSL
ncbi:MAG: ATP-binding protein [Herpetosiphon sp.]